VGEQFLRMSVARRRDALSAASERLKRPLEILEKDIMVVWALSVIYGSEHGAHLSFKGGTSLSKVYGVIDRFSEDVDLTYDIRRFLPEFNITPDGIPPSKSKARSWTEEVREKLPAWIQDELVPLFSAAAERDGIKINFRNESKEKLFLDYETVTKGTSYVKPSVMLEFGARSTGEPTETANVSCDAAGTIDNLEFPATEVRAMAMGRTFWEKATAAHVYSIQESLKGDRFSRHWHDLHYIAGSESIKGIIADRDLAKKVATHKSFFFAERDGKGGWVDYTAAVTGGLQLVPVGAPLQKLAEDYARMAEAGMTSLTAPSFDTVMETCARLQELANT
jgi:hypothetical protein